MRKFGTVGLLDIIIE